jgi:scyllo-inositol 2-dehydrogenase (NADP+)
VAGAYFHAPFIAAASGLRLAAVVTRDPGRAAAVRQRHPGARLLATPDEIWSAGDIDVVVVASPNRTHVPLALGAVEAGLPVVVDKPVAATVADAVRLRDAATAAGASVSVFHNRRWDGDFRTVAALVGQGRLGAVHRFESRFERWRPEVRAGAWKERPDPAEAGGILHDLGTHLIDQALTLFGPVTHVYAENRGVRRQAAVSDDVFVALTHASGTVSHLWASALAADLGPRLRVLGSEAAYVKSGMDVQEAALRAGGNPADAGWGVEPEQAWGRLGVPEETVPVPTEPGDYGAFYAGLETHLRLGAPAPVTLDEAIAGLRVVEAAAVSAAQRRVVAL